VASGSTALVIGVTRYKTNPLWLREKLRVGAGELEQWEEENQ